MSLQIKKVLNISTLYYQVELSIIVNYPVANHFYRTRIWHIIFTAPCPRGENLRNPYHRGSTVSGKKGSRPQIILPSSRNTTHPPLNLLFARIEFIVPPKVSHNWIPSHWTFFISLSCGMQVFYIGTN